MRLANRYSASQAAWYVDRSCCTFLSLLVNGCSSRTPLDGWMDGCLSVLFVCLLQRIPQLAGASRQVSAVTTENVFSFSSLEVEWGI